MKARNVFLVVLFMIVLSSPFVAAEVQGPGEPRNAISVDLLGPIVACAFLIAGQGVVIPVGIEYQRVISDHFTLFFMGGLIYRIFDGWALDAYPIVEVDWHPFHKGLKGFHVGLLGSFLYEQVYSSAAETQGTTYWYHPAMELAVGWQFLLPASIILDLTLGLLSVGYDFNVDVNGVMTSGLMLGDPMESNRTSLSLGFRF
ncbi:MAG: hypothetical protein ABSF77_14425 [Spirochaetia bacterium]|jgi:hypothetical protein